MMELQQLQEQGTAPHWLTEEGFSTLSSGYLLPDETPKDMWWRVSNSASKYLNKPELAEKFFTLFWNNWLCGATPILSNLGTERGLPISCNSIEVGDSVQSIFEKQTELAMLSKHGAGVGIYLGNIRAAGTNIAGNGKSFGVGPWLKCYDSTTVAVSQGSTRRGASAVYLDVEHGDIRDFLTIRKPTANNDLQCLNLHQGVCIPDRFMEKVEQGDSEARDLWVEILKTRVATGEPYLFFNDNVNRQNPECYKKRELKVKTSNICVTGDQRVVTSKGLKTVYDLYQSQEELQLFDGQKQVSASPMKLIEKNAKVWKISTKEGRTHCITKDHKIKTEQGMVACKDLEVGTKIAIQRKKGLFGSHRDLELAYDTGVNQSNSKYDTQLEIPEWITLSDKETQIRYLNGLAYAFTCFSDISLSFLQDIQIMLSNLGINCKINAKESWWNLVPNDQEFDTIISIEQIENQDVYCTTVNSDKHVWVCNSFITSNCNEIYLHTSEENSFVCCLSSLNLVKYDEWKNTDAVQLAIWFLDGVMSEYIDKAKNKFGFRAAVNFAVKSRALGLGVLGWHTLLQEKKIPFESFEAMKLNAEIFKLIQKESDIASQNLAKEYGEPEWCEGSGMRNSHKIACAPTVSNSIISSSVSPGIEPIIGNIFALKTAKGTFFRYNGTLKRLLKEKGKDTHDTWKKINQDNGSVQKLDFLNEEEKKIFLTAREISQFAIISQASQRQKYIDQGQSVNLFFYADSSPKEIHQVHMKAWKEGMKGLYYLRSESVLRGDSAFRGEECTACEG